MESMLLVNYAFNSLKNKEMATEQNHLVFQYCKIFLSPIIKENKVQ